ncbi:hypothetical protein AA957_00410 [Pseudomonas trivialis]|uniref:Uncharacterized protein n=1 Tax=Pseudomonas trivialis TaxID=200450 RepID=A0A0H5AKR8_9PSED|nr:hypothetical protein AA957_00410 [Pseudomonas trivialis]
MRKIDQITRKGLVLHLVQLRKRNMLHSVHMSQVMWILMQDALMKDARHVISTPRTIMLEQSD